VGLMFIETFAQGRNVVKTRARLTGYYRRNGACSGKAKIAGGGRFFFWNRRK